MAGRGHLTTKRLTLGACILGSGIAVLDSTVVNVALPTIQRELGGGLAAQQWVVNAYLLTLGSLILIGGSLADLFGERRIFALGVSGFGLASVACALAPSVQALIAARAVQGATSALLTPSALAVIVSTFPPRERGTAIGSWTAWTGVAVVIGPLLGGELLALGSWRLVFLINVPLVAVCLALILIAIPKAQRTGGGLGRVDAPGALLCALGLGGPVFALIEQPRLGWADPAVSVSLGGGLLLLALFVLYERRAGRQPEARSASQTVGTPPGGRRPMLPLGLFAHRNFSVGNLQTLAMYAGLAVVSFFVVLFLQQIGGYTPLQSGVALMPITLVMLLLSRTFGALASRFGPRLFMGCGPLLSAAGLLLFERLGARVDFLGEVLPAVLVFAFGLTVTVAPLTAAVLAEVGEGEAGIASAVNNAVARVAALLATAAVGAAVAASFSASLHAHLLQGGLGAPARAALARAERLPLGRPSVRELPAAQAKAVSAAAERASVHGFHVGIAIAAGLLAVGGLIGLAGIRNPRRAGASASQPMLSA